MNKQKLIFDILRCALNGCDESSHKCFEKVSDDEWKWAYSVLSMHGVSVFAYTAIEYLPVEYRPHKEVILKFISSSLAAERNYSRLSNIVKAIDDLLSKNQVTCLLLKGMSLSDYYPKPHMRTFADVDIYAPDMGKELDRIFSDSGLHVDNDFYRHSHVSFSGITIENHKCLLDLRGRQAQCKFDDDLRIMAKSYLSGKDKAGLHYPPPAFSLLFNLHHALSHFIYEGISFKFLVDWILLIRAETETINSQLIADMIRQHNLVKFAAMMTRVAVDLLGLRENEVPEFLSSAVQSIDPAVEIKFIDDLFRDYEQVHSSNRILDRLGLAKRIINAAWKPKEFLGQSSFMFVIHKFVPIFLGRKGDEF